MDRRAFFMMELPGNEESEPIDTDRSPKEPIAIASLNSLPVNGQGTMASRRDFVSVLATSAIGMTLNETVQGQQPSLSREQEKLRNCEIRNVEMWPDKFKEALKRARELTYKELANINLQAVKYGLIVDFATWSTMLPTGNNLTKKPAFTRPVGADQLVNISSEHSIYNKLFLCGSLGIEAAAGLLLHEHAHVWFNQFLATNSGQFSQQDGEDFCFLITKSHFEEVLVQAHLLFSMGRIDTQQLNILVDTARKQIEMAPKLPPKKLQPLFIQCKPSTNITAESHVPNR